MPEKAGTLAAALVLFQAEMPKVHKGKTAHVPTKAGGSYSYTYADLADVTAAAVPVLTKHGLSFTTRPARTEQGDYELVGVLMHTSGEESTGSLPIHGRTAQEIGSSITYGRRYLFGCLTGIVTDDDDDAQVANTTAERARRQPPPETPEQRLSNARARAWGLFREANPAANQQDFTQAYEEWAALPFADAGADEFRSFAAHLAAQS